MNTCGVTSSGALLSVIRGIIPPGCRGVFFVRGVVSFMGVVSVAVYGSSVPGMVEREECVPANLNLNISNPIPHGK